MCFKHRKELNEVLASNSNLDRGSFFKILALGIFDILLNLPVGIFYLVLKLLEGDIPTFWPGWRASHSEFSSIPTVTAIEWKSGGFGAVSSIIISQWSSPLYAIVFFTLFGLTEKNRQWYANLFWKILEPFGCKPRQNPVASDIVFHSTPVHPGFDVSRAGTTITSVSSYKCLKPSLLLSHLPVGLTSHRAQKLWTEGHPSTTLPTLKKRGTMMIFSALRPWLSPSLSPKPP